MKKLLWVVVLVVVVACGIGVRLAVQPAEAAEDALLVPGQTYAVLWSCLAQIGCYGEVLTVNAVRKDGWATVTDTEGTQWTINLSQIISFRPYRADQHRRASL